MQKNDQNLCEQCVSYMLGECSAEERAMFERHLTSCPSCRQELQDMRFAWQMLPLGAEQVEVPSDLKAEVMDAIFSSGPAAAPLPRKKRFLWRNGLVAALVPLLIASVIWNILLQKDRKELARPDVPAHIVSIQPFHAADAAFALSKGTACILQQGDHTNLVIYLYNLPATKGGETYQVWMHRDGSQSNAGTFRVGDDGLGVLVTEMRPEDRFDSIGVTLEPNASGTEPRRNAVISAQLSHSTS
jgi:Anti-sigma-K factor rskA/Putative zinc-finger